MFDFGELLSDAILSAVMSDERYDTGYQGLQVNTWII
jgi:hypothetical protein